jgi:hypothetical protein
MQHAAAVYDAMKTMYQSTEAENKRLLSTLAEKDAVIAAGLQREEKAAAAGIETHAAYHDLLNEHLAWLKKYGKLQNQHIALGRESMEASREKKVALGRCKRLIDKEKARLRRERMPIRTRSVTKAARDKRCCRR